MKLRDPKTFEPIFNKDGVTGRSLTKGDNFEIIFMTLEPGADLKPHTTPFDAEFFIHKGNAVYVIGGKEIKASEETIISCPGNIEHGIRNDTDEELIVLVIKKL